VFQITLIVSVDSFSMALILRISRSLRGQGYAKEKFLTGSETKPAEDARDFPQTIAFAYLLYKIFILL
jgi:hypothetical protein